MATRRIIPGDHGLPPRTSTVAGPTPRARIPVPGEGSAPTRAVIPGEPKPAPAKRHIVRTNPNHKPMTTAELVARAKARGRRSLDRAALREQFRAFAPHAKPRKPRKQPPQQPPQQPEPKK